MNDIQTIVDDPTESRYRRIMAADVSRYMFLKEGDHHSAEATARDIIEWGVYFLTDSDATKEQHREVYDAIERAYITLAPNDFHSYLMALEWRRPAKARFYQPRMAVLKPVADTLTDMMVNDIYDIVMLSMPPRAGKSTLGLLFVSWVAGRNPDEPMLMTGYAEKITKMFYDGLTEIYEDSDYNYHAVFPHIDLVHTSAKDLTLDFRNDAKKSTRKYKTITCRAIDGSLTGATEARQLLYCDDLVRDIEEALNPNRLVALGEKLMTNVYSRKKEGCKELHIGTRWSVHDPMGLVARQNEDNPRCKVIVLPALDPDTDESNFDYPYGVGFSTEFYRELRRKEDEVTWECVYQQNPIERAGLLFPPEDLIYCYEIPSVEDNRPDDAFAFCDVAFGGNDYLALPIAYQWGDEPPVIVDVVFMKGGYKETQPKVAGALIKHKVARAMFEANAGGDFYSRDIADILKEQHYNCHITAVRAASNKSKETRIIQHSPAIKEFTFLHPRSDACSPMYRQFLNNLTTYTQSGKNLNDDAPDALAGLAAMMRTNLNAQIAIYDRKHL